MTWKEHIASSMRGKKFGSRAEANAFMKKLSAEWKSKKGGAVNDEVDYDDKGLGEKPMKKCGGKGVDEFQYMPKGVASGSGKRVAKKLVVRGDESDSDDDKMIDLVEGGRIRIRGGSNSLLLQKGLGDGVHLSVLPK